MAKITDRELSGKAQDKDIWLYDGAAIKGHGELCVRITTGGKKQFYFRYTGPEGERVRLPIGKYNQSGTSGFSLKDARKRAGELSLLHQRGITDIKGHLEAETRIEVANQAAEEAKFEAERVAAAFEASRLTVAELFSKWFEQRISKRKDGGKETRRLFEKDVLPAIGPLPAHLIRKGHIMEIADKIEGRGAARTAKIVFANMRQMFKFALARDFVEIDPTSAIAKVEIGGKDVERDRVLTDDEIKLLALQIPKAGLTPTATAAIWIALATGCRIGELLKARWEHIDLDKRQWLIPDENSKNGESLEVYISDFALINFRALEQHRKSDWLYPARNKDKGDIHVCVKTVTKQIGDRQKVNIKKNRTQKRGTLVLPGGNWFPHDLRRTCSTLMGSLGIKPEVIDRCQNHKEQNRIRRTYQRYSYAAEMREAWELLGSRLEALTSGQEMAKVILLREPA